MATSPGGSVHAVLAPGASSASVSGRRPVAAASSRPLLLQTLRRAINTPTGLFGAMVLSLLVVAAVAAPWLAPYDPLQQHAGSELLPPNPTFWLGTDNFGRDEVSRLIYGARISFVVAILATALGASVGVLGGVVAGYSGGFLDTAVMRLADVLFSFPAILLGIALVTVLGPGLLQTALALAIAQTPYYARVMRAVVLALRDREFVIAAHSFGAGAGRIVWRHVLPNCTTPLLVQLSLSLGFNVLAEAGLSFIGLGLQPPTASWGNMLSESQRFVDRAPWLAWWPGVAIGALVLGLNFLSDAARDALDPSSLGR
jgi:peptide/nickel transport system permease protein